MRWYQSLAKAAAVNISPAEAAAAAQGVRVRNTLTAGLLTLFVGGTYAYTLHRVGRKDDFEEAIAIHQAAAAIVSGSDPVSEASTPPPVETGPETQPAIVSLHILPLGSPADANKESTD